MFVFQLIFSSLSLFSFFFFGSADKTNKKGEKIGWHKKKKAQKNKTLAAKIAQNRKNTKHIHKQTNKYRKM